MKPSPTPATTDATGAARAGQASAAALDEQKLMVVDAQQRQRALALASFIVEAPAGAGKTELLTQRYLRLLATVDEPEEILAITFTNKAAAEMRSRLLHGLQRAARQDCPAEPHKQLTHHLAGQVLARSQARGWQLMAQPARLRVLTIDALCAQLARQMPLLSRFGTQPRAAAEADVHYQEAARRTLALLDDPRHEAHAQCVATVLAHVDNNSCWLQEALADMLARREQWGACCHEIVHMAEHWPQQLIQAVSAYQEAALRAAQTVLDEARQRRLMPLVRFAAANLDAAVATATDTVTATDTTTATATQPSSSSSPLASPLATPTHPLQALRDWDAPLQPVAGQLPQWLALLHVLLTQESGLRKSVDKRLGFPSGDATAKAMKQAMLAELQACDGQPLEALAALRRLPVLTDCQAHAELVLAVSQLLILASAQLWLVFHEAGEVDFAEIASRAIAALGEADAPSDLALRLDYRIQHVLVDEFQDTSPTQVALLERLTAGWQPGDGRTLFAVGDPMQSIYRFRQAEVGLFLRVAEHGLGALRLERLRLYRNNRSCPEVVEWCNRNFARIFPAADAPEEGAICYRPSLSVRQDLSAGDMPNGVFVHGVSAPAGSERTRVHQLEAQRVLELIDSERACYPERRIAVLVRARNHLAALVAEMRRSRPQLHFQALEIETLAQRQVVQDLLSLTRALLHRGDRLHWLAVLRAPWCGLRLADLHALAADERQATIWSLMHDEARLQRLSADGQQRLRHVRRVLSDALAQQGRMPLARWLESTWLRLGGAACLAPLARQAEQAQAQAQAAATDVRCYLELLAQLDRGGELDVDELVRRMEKLFAATDSHAEAPRLQLMTVHKSKGLEFDTVILPGLARKAGGRTEALLLWDDMAGQDSGALAAVARQTRSASGSTLYSLLRRREAARIAEEDRRVLYVAATRAIHRLHLVAALVPGSKGTHAAPAGSSLQLLWSLPEVQDAFAPACEPAAAAPVVPGAVQDAAATERFVPRLLRVPVASQPALWDAWTEKAAQLEPAGNSDEALEPAQLGAMATEHPAAPSASSEAGDVAERMLRFDRLTTDVGTLVHAYLELIAKDGLEAWPLARITALAPAMRLWLRRRGHAPARLEEGVAKASAALQQTLQSEQGRWLLGAHPGAVAEEALSSGEAGLQAGAPAGSPMRQHVVDRSFIHAGVRWIIDYKTAQVSQKTPSAASLQAHAERFRQQLERYADLYADEGLPQRLAIFYVLHGCLVELPGPGGVDSRDGAASVEEVAMLR